MSKNRRLHLRLAGADAPTHRHASNPFANWTPELMTRHKRLELGIGGPQLFDKEGKEAVGTMLIPYQRDAARFVKLFYDELDELPELSHTALSVLFFLLKQALPNNNIAYLPIDEGMAFCGFNSQKSYYDGISELIIYEYLARTTRISYYYLNARKVFTGNRRSTKELFIGPTKKTPTTI